MPSKRNRLTLAPTRTRRYKRQQLLKLQEADQPANAYWVDSQELAGNAHCLILAQDPRQFEEFQGPQTRRRANLSKAPRTLLFALDSPEPTEVRAVCMYQRSCCAVRIKAALVLTRSM